MLIKCYKEIWSKHLTMLLFAVIAIWAMLDIFLSNLLNRIVFMVIFSVDDL